MFNLRIAYGAKDGLKLKLTIFYSMRKGGIEKAEKKSINKKYSGQNQLHNITLVFGHHH